jgi:hypothetical protein
MASSTAKSRLHANQARTGHVCTAAVVVAASSTRTKRASAGFTTLRARLPQDYGDRLYR